MSLFCANRNCDLPSLLTTDARVEVKAATPTGWKKAIHTMAVKWKGNGEAAFHVDCWKSILKQARARSSSSASKSKRAKNLKSPGTEMKEAEKVMIKQAVKTMEKFDSYEDVKGAAKKAAKIIKSAHHCIAFTGAGISTSAGLGDFRGKSGKWTEEDNTAAVDKVINSAFQASAVASDKISQESPSASQLSPEKDGEEEEEEEEIVDYENLRPTYTHEALKVLTDKGILRYIVSQNCDGLHLLSGISPDKISELHGNVFVERCPGCHTRYTRNSYTLSDEASAYYEELEDFGRTDLRKPKFAKQCELCGLCHRTGRSCDAKGCRGMLEDTIINFRDNLEEDVLDGAMQMAERSDVILCLGTTLMVTPACDIVEMAPSRLPLIVCNRQKTDKDSIARVRVFGDCDVFMREVMREILGEEECGEWEGQREERMDEYNTKRQLVASSSSSSSSTKTLSASSAEKTSSSVSSPVKNSSVSSGSSTSGLKKKRKLDETEDVAKLKRTKTNDQQNDRNQNKGQGKKKTKGRKK